MKRNPILISVFSIFFALCALGCVAALEDDLTFSCYDHEDCPKGMMCKRDANYDRYCAKTDNSCESASDCGDHQGCDENAQQCRDNWCDDNDDCRENWSLWHACDSSGACVEEFY